jgi:hypothetical protein
LQASVLNFAGYPLWFYLTVAAMLLIVSEWYLHQRRWLT